MIITKNKLVIGSFDVENKIVDSVYTGRADIGLGVEHIENLLVFLKSNEVKGMLFDVRKLYGSWAKLLEYYEGVFPLARDHGLSCVAYITSDDIITNNLILKLQEMGNSFNVKMSIFSNYEEAKKWIKENN